MFNVLLHDTRGGKDKYHEPVSIVNSCDPTRDNLPLINARIVYETVVTFVLLVTDDNSDLL